MFITEMPFHSRLGQIVDIIEFPSYFGESVSSISLDLNCLKNSFFFFFTYMLLFKILLV